MYRTKRTLREIHFIKCVNRINIAHSTYGRLQTICLTDIQSMGILFNRHLFNGDTETLIIVFWYDCIAVERSYMSADVIFSISFGRRFVAPYVCWPKVPWPIPLWCYIRRPIAIQNTVHPIITLIYRLNRRSVDQLLMFIR